MIPPCQAVRGLLLTVCLMAASCVCIAQESTQPPPPEALSRAGSLIVEQKLAEALALLQPLENDEKQVHQVRLLEAQCYLGLKQTDKALALYQSLAADAPYEIKLTALQAIGAIHLAAGDLAKAEESLRAAAGIYGHAEDARLKALARIIHP